jgi:putative heme transporter
VLLIVVGVAIVVATFAFFLPKLASYAEVWDVVQTLSWAWIVALLAVTVLNVATFAPPWMVALPGLRFLQALEMTQASTALSILLPAGTAAGIATQYGMLRAWGFQARDVARAVTLVSLWNQFCNLLYPVVGVFLLVAFGEQAALLATAAFIGVAVLGISVAAFVVALVSSSLAYEVGELAARVANWVLKRFGRGPVSWGGESFEQFRLSAGDLLKRRWHALTIASLAGSLTVFVVLLVSLRALDVPSSQVSFTEAFAAWALVRLIGSVPITPGDIGIVELGLTTALIGFGGNNAGVVAAVLVYRFLTMVPTLVLGLIAAATWRRYKPPPAEPVEVHPVGTMPASSTEQRVGP